MRPSALGRFSAALVLSLVIGLQGHPAFAVCDYVGATCDNPPSGVCSTYGVCTHTPSTNFYWDYDCPSACCEQGLCDVWERDPNNGTCVWFCFADNISRCVFGQCS
jgi:hypothetical protein